ncbi:hypothetical protein DRQ00_09250 [candidate division KSB1 bacterium]|nr:MAG: hypothetical protein DRQ00_09250 [candidate division KSB1 bacterium]
MNGREDEYNLFFLQRKEGGFCLVFFIIIALIAPFSVIFSQTTVCLDAGHGGDDPGTLGYDGHGYPNEEDITLAIATATEGEMRDVFGVLNVYISSVASF